MQLGISNKIWPIHLRSILKILGHEIWKPRPTRGHFQTLLTSLVGFLHIFHPIFMKVQLLATAFSVAPSSIPKAWRSTLPLSSSIHSLAWTVMHETVKAVSQNQVFWFPFCLSLALSCLTHTNGNIKIYQSIHHLSSSKKSSHVVYPPEDLPEEG